MTFVEEAMLEVEWYREHGKYPERIATNFRNVQFVRSDFFWNSKYPWKSEHVMRPIANHIAKAIAERNHAKAKMPDH